MTAVYCEWLHTEMVYSPTSVTYPSTNLAAHGRESNLQPVDYKYDAITIALPSHYSTLCTKQDVIESSSDTTYWFLFTVTRFISFLINETKNAF